MIPPGPVPTPYTFNFNTAPYDPNKPLGGLQGPPGTGFSFAPSANDTPDNIQIPAVPAVPKTNDVNNALNAINQIADQPEVDNFDKIYQLNSTLQDLFDVTMMGNDARPGKNITVKLDRDMDYWVNAMLKSTTVPGLSKVELELIYARAMREYNAAVEFAKKELEKGHGSQKARNEKHLKDLLALKKNFPTKYRRIKSYI